MKADKNGWPKYITRLEPDDLIRGEWLSECNTRGCLIGRIAIDFCGTPDPYGAILFGDLFTPAAREFLIGVLRRLKVSNTKHIDRLDDDDLICLASQVFEHGSGGAYVDDGDSCPRYILFSRPRRSRPSDVTVCRAWNDEAEARGYTEEVNR